MIKILQSWQEIQESREVLKQRGLDFTEASKTRFWRFLFDLRFRYKLFPPHTDIIKSWDVARVAQLIAKIMNTKATFTMREPDTKPPFHADNDACYLCNPIDFVKFLPTQNCTVFQNGFYGRPQWTTLIYSGTFIAARKLT